MGNGCVYWIIIICVYLRCILTYSLTIGVGGGILWETFSLGPTLKRVQKNCIRR